MPELFVGTVKWVCSLDPPDREELKTLPLELLNEWGATTPAPEIGVA
jgi:hypothetical protein